MTATHSPLNNFHLTSEFVQHTARHIFLTGKAGTGKTTFLKHIREHCDKRMAVVAPTGVAAINAGGVTAHSFFQLPLGAYYPGAFRGGFHSASAITDHHHLLRNLRITKEKRDLMQNLDLLIIDEVSMLRCDMLDAIDAILQHVRSNSRQPFGGVQVLLIGDLYQLPPVISDGEKELLKDFYQSPFFFDALVYKEADPLCIELNKVFRQSDEEFIHLLNRVRNNETTEEDLQRLRMRYQPSFQPPRDEHFITLTTHNSKVDQINAAELHRLPGKAFTCEATIRGDFPDRIFPVEKSMRLKQGAQIMFIRNDTEEKKYFNGKIGVLAGIDHDEEDEFIRVTFPGTPEEIAVRKVTWENKRYKFNETTNSIEEDQLGSFTQYPVRLAWAVTIHKSQGLTFQRAIIDAGKAFAAGQVYVALSRCVSLDGMVLLSPIHRQVIMTDPAVAAFMNQQNNIEALLPLLQREKEIFAIRKIIQLFELNSMIAKVQDFMVYLGERKVEMKEDLIGDLHTIHEALLKLQDLAEKFRVQVHTMTAGGFNESVGAQLNERVTKAKAYFEKELDEKVNFSLEKLNNKIQQQSKVRKLLKELGTFMTSFEQFTNRFRAEPKSLTKKFEAGDPSPSQKKEIPEEASLDLLQELRQLRRQLAQKENAPPYMICQDAALIEMSTYFPQSITDMAMIKGMRGKSLNKYGETFLSVVRSYTQMHGLSSRMTMKEEDAQRKKQDRQNKDSADGDSKTRSFLLFKSGKSVAEIASIRSMAPTTIEGHLAQFVKSGELDVFSLISREKFDMISEAIRQTSEAGLSPVKGKLGDTASYSEIRLVFNALNRDGAQTSSS